MHCALSLVHLYMCAFESKSDQMSFISEMSREVQEAFLRVGTYHGETNSTDIEIDAELEICSSFDLIIKSLKSFPFLSLHLSSGSISEPQSL